MDGTAVGEAAGLELTGTVVARQDLEPIRIYRGQRVLELGAGGGTVGMALARLGATVTVSDIPAMLPVLEFNVARNFKCSNSCSSSDGPITVMEHCWGEKLNGGPYDMVVGSDIVYTDRSFEPLLKTMVDAARQGARVLQAYAPQRGDAPSFEMEEPSERFMKLAEKHFTAVALLEDSMPLECDKKIAPFGHESPISIYEFKLRT